MELSRYASSDRLELLLLLFAVTAAITDVSGGEAYNFSLALFCILAVWQRNARGALFCQILLLLALVLDVIYFVRINGRNATATAFQALSFIEKIAALFFMHYFLREQGAGYSWSTPVTGAGAVAPSVGTLAAPFTGTGSSDAKGASDASEATAEANINFSTYQSGGAVSYQA